MIGLCLPGRCDAANRDAARAAARLFGEAGCEIIDLPTPDALGARAIAVIGTLLGVSTADWVDAMGLAPDDLPPMIQAMAEAGRATSGPGVYAMTREIARISHDAWALFDTCDAIVMPVLAGPPAPLGTVDFNATDVAAHLAQVADTAPNAALANVAGLPALSIPMGMATPAPEIYRIYTADIPQISGPKPLPLGVQLVGPVGSDSVILALAERIAKAVPKVPYPAPIPGWPA